MAELTAFPLPKPDARRIVILGCGTSLDRFDLDSIPDEPETLVITTNSAITVARTDVQIASDPQAVEAYHEYQPGTPWISRGKNRDPLIDHDLPHVITEDWIDRKYSRGSGAEAFFVAYHYAINLLPGQIESITVVGIDMCGLATRSRSRFSYGYAHTLRPYLLAAFNQPAKAIPHAGFWDRDDLCLSFTNNDSYRTQGHGIAKLMADDEFAALIRSESWVDHTKLSPTAYDLNFRSARRSDPRGGVHGRGPKATL